MDVDCENHVGSDYDVSAAVGDDNHGGSDQGEKDSENPVGAVGENDDGGEGGRGKDEAGSDNQDDDDDCYGYDEDYDGDWGGDNGNDYDGVASDDSCTASYLALLLDYVRTLIYTSHSVV